MLIQMGVHYDVGESLCGVDVALARRAVDGDLSFRLVDDATPAF